MPCDFRSVFFHFHAEATSSIRCARPKYAMCSTLRVEYSDGVESVPEGSSNTKRLAKEKIVGILKEAGAGLKPAELCHKYGISEATYLAQFGPT